MTWWWLGWLGVASGQETVCPVGQTTGCDYASLEDAVDLRAPDLLLLAGDHLGGVEIREYRTHIVGEPGARIVGAAGLGVQLDVLADEVVLEDLTLRPNEAGSASALHAFGNQVTLRRVVVDGGDGLGPPGILVLGGAVVLEACTLRGFRGRDSGAAIRMGDGTLVASDTTFTDNQAATGAGAHVWATAAASLTINGGTMSGGFSRDGGGAIALRDGASLTLTGTTLDTNGTAAGAGAAVHAVGAGAIELVGVTATGHDVPALSVEDSTAPLVVRDSVFDGNPGGALVARGVDQLTLQDTWFCHAARTSVEIEGGCDDHCWVHDVAFAGTTTTTSGMPTGLSVQDPSYATIERATFTANTTAGGMYAIDLGPRVDVRGLLVYDNPGSPSNVLYDPVLLPDPTRCPTLAVVPACDPANQVLFDDHIGFGTSDRDQDGAAWPCDCDGDDNVVDAGEDCPEDTGLPPADTADTADPGDEPPPSNSDDAGCGCAQAPAHSRWLSLLARRPR